MGCFVCINVESACSGELSVHIRLIENKATFIDRKSQNFKVVMKQRNTQHDLISLNTELGCFACINDESACSGELSVYIRLIQNKATFIDRRSQNFKVVMKQRNTRHDLIILNTELGCFVCTKDESACSSELPVD